MEALKINGNSHTEYIFLPHMKSSIVPKFKY
jgi:hypothetical protein